MVQAMMHHHLRIYQRRWQSSVFCSSFVIKKRPTTILSRPLQQPMQQQQPRPPSHRFNAALSRRTYRHSTELFDAKKKQWNVGDPVVITTAATPKRGEVVSVRGAGWYSIKMSNDQQIVKVRSNQMKSIQEEYVDILATSSENNNETSLFAPGPTLEADPGRQTLHPPPPPLIQDLDALLKDATVDPSRISNIEREFLKQVGHHAQYEKWIVFTDLHCSPSTLNTSLQVLDVVHETAMQHNAGILFLGDFWHHRGILRVDCLNAVLKSLESWRVPLVMIPGNHDQVTLGGHDHGLTPLANAYRVRTTDGDNDDTVAGPLILSYPTVFRKGLFVPHIRDTATMESVLQSQLAQDATALFVHAEVKGALMNDLLISTHGIPPSSFPSHKSIYSGHFHKPHIVQSSFSRDGAETSTVSVEYLGSPYEVSLAEAEQDKQLVLLDQNWQCEQRIPLNLGRKHFKISSWEDLLQLRMTDGESKGGGHKHLKKGDRVVLTLPAQRREGFLDSNENAMLNNHVQLLRTNGVMLEVREDNTRPFSTMLPNNPLNDIAPEEMTPESIWKAYLKDAEMRESIDENVSSSLLRTGLEILEDIARDGVEKSQEGQFDLKLNQIKVHGFGPFRESITYPLYNRGLVLLRGLNSEAGPDSNGSGKSSLAMATLWALTGTLDARRSMDMRVADVINDDSKMARVTVEGFINDVPFIVSRTKTPSSGDLFFQLDGVDMTTQSMKETQILLEERLGIVPELLLRSIFHGQHGMNDLLEATDAKLKEELSLVVPVDLWQTAATIARARTRDAKKQYDVLEGMKRVRSGDIENLERKIDEAKATRDEKFLRFKKAKMQLDSIIANTEHDMSGLPDPENPMDIQRQLDTLAKEIQTLLLQLDEKAKSRESALIPLQVNLEEAMVTRDTLSRQLAEQNMKIATSKVEVSAAATELKKLEAKWSLDLSQGIPSSLVPPEVCPTCLQPLSQKGSHHDHINIEETIKKEVELAFRAIQSAESELNNAMLIWKQYSNTTDSLDTEIEILQREISEQSQKWDSVVKTLQGDIQKKRNSQTELTSQLSSFVKKSQQTKERDAATATFNMEQMALQHASEVIEGLESELCSAMDMLKQIDSEKEHQETKRRLLSDVAERCGQRGVQAYILQNVVESLQLSAQRYLDCLSEGGQRLELSLDAGEKFSRMAYVRGPDGAFKQRPLSTLSGGQWRRCSLALSFAFAELVARRGRLKSSLMILDEPLTHLDRSGRTKFGEVVRMMINGGTIEDEFVLFELQFSTVILILQDLSAEELEEAFDRMDTVVRANGGSYVQLDEE
ncbi:SMC domain containing protein [Nitzschia inconspicua]|uniref:SMC domain containing protein n=1 Tax=Nitzschia inconspicua TaxID=303405 RepID=A0A9K3KYK0_9STRA|nr:SMC domain containing protein [Nitzschia inconspicua]